MLLGSLMRNFDNETHSAEALLSLGDIVLIAQVDAARQSHNESLGEYVSGAVKRFSHLAGDDDWLRLMTALKTSEQPAAACLKTMVHWSIARERTDAGPSGGCSCVGGVGGCHDQA